MVASLWPHRLPFTAVIKRSTSVSVRYSRVRRSALGARLGVTVRFTVAGVTSLRCDLAMGFAFPVLTTVRTRPLLRTVASGRANARLARQAGRPSPQHGQAGGCRWPKDVSRKYLGPKKPFLRFALLAGHPAREQVRDYAGQRLL